MQRIRNANRMAIWASLAILLALLIVESNGEKYRVPSKVSYLDERQQTNDNSNSLDGQYGIDSAEQVDRLASAAGDLYWPALMPQLPADWYQQALAGRLHQLDLESPLSAAVYQYQQLPRAEKRHFTTSNFRYNNLAGINGDMDPSVDVSGAPSYRALINDLKHWSHQQLSPSRETRAFKPKLMSTARGFGKRAYGQDAGANSYGDILTGPNPMASITVNGKMSGNAVR